MTLALCLGVLVSSCSSDDAIRDKNYIGSWKTFKTVGDKILNDISGVTVTEKTITMTFKEGSELFNEFGAQNTVNYTFKSQDKTWSGDDFDSFTFDKPLYYVGNKQYVSKCFAENDNGKISFSTESLLNTVIFNK